MLVVQLQFQYRSAGRNTAPNADGGCACPADCHTCPASIKQVGGMGRHPQVVFGLNAVLVLKLQESAATVMACPMMLHPFCFSSRPLAQLVPGHMYGRGCDATLPAVHV